MATGKKKNNSRTIGNIVRTIINISINVIVLAVLISFTYRGAGMAYEFGKAIFAEEAMTTEEEAKNYSVTIPKSPSAMEIAKVLEEAKLIENRYVFLVQLKLSESEEDIIPGTYILSTSMTPSKMIEVMCTQEQPSEESGEAK